MPRIAIAAPIVAIAVVAIVTVQLRSAPEVEPPPAPVYVAPEDRPSSQLDEAGLDEVAASNAFVLNLVGAVPAAADLGLPADGAVEVVRDGSAVRTILVTPDGEITRGPMRSIVVTTAGGAIVSVAAMRESFGFGAFTVIRSELAAGVEDFGWVFGDAEEDALLSTVADAVRADAPTRFEIVPGAAAGIAVGATVDCVSGGQCYLQYVMTPV
ncbi:hypothetical protein [Agrococcus jejuensis]|uniref:Uncharacterized protein n=1 Tax=Agrococcus jejuensis TaxID=399736 RepID=A0A1G8EMV7_9MICO|nr:hypothetical protein [Agrococcus jejuensis]SDH71243.1 hypothetical protein SAMN04489720_2114 [Agrococcus jejuensis]